MDAGDLNFDFTITLHTEPSPQPKFLIFIKFLLYERNTSHHLFNLGYLISPKKTKIKPRAFKKRKKEIYY